MPLISKASLLLKSPGTALAFARYQLIPERQYNGFRLRNFSCFSEYLNPDFLSTAEQCLLTEYSFPEGDVIDVGAHIGFVSLLMARRYPDRVLHAFEASPSTHSSFVGNLKLNGINNVRAYNVAIADHEGCLDFNVDPRHRATNSIALKSDTHKVSVPCVTIDNFVRRQNVNQIALLKIDVEGYEDVVLKGADETLNNTHMVFYEVCPSNNRKAGTDIKLPFRILTEHGFAIYHFVGEKLSPASLSDLEKVTLDNWVAIKSSAIDQ
ncbi:MAG TPA: FkbM family methyltransferase [Pyrinomonadaceae bacterium]|jgi:FkbM family methyltransferase